jgi:ABC-type amino acid transport substrate-binding protein
MRSLLATLLLLSGAAIGHADEPAPKPTLRFGMETRGLPLCFVPGLDYSKEDRHKPPLVSPAQLRRLEGLEVDILHALAARLGVEAVVVPESWFDLEAGLTAGRFDLILASWTPSERTRDDVVASDAYYHWGLLVAVRADDRGIRSLADLAGRRIGHFSDPAVTRALQEMGAGLEAQLVAGEDGGVLFERLRSGAVDAVLFDSPELRWRVAQDPQAFRVVGEPLNRLGYHVGVRRGDFELLTRVNDAIHALVGSADMRAIEKRWGGAP